MSASDGASGSTSERGPSDHLRGEEDGRAATGERRDAEDILDPEAVLSRPGNRGAPARWPSSGIRATVLSVTSTSSGNPATQMPSGDEVEEDRVIGEEIETGPDQRHRGGGLAGATRTRDEHAPAVERQAGGVQREPLEALHRLDEGDGQERVGGQHLVTRLGAGDRELDEPLGRACTAAGPAARSRRTAGPNRRSSRSARWARHRSGDPRLPGSGGQLRSQPGPRTSTTTSGGRVPAVRRQRNREPTSSATDGSSQLTSTPRPARS